MAKTKSHPEDLTASSFSALVGADRHEITKKLGELGATPTGTKNGGKTFTLRDLINAHLGGDERAARMRKLKAEAERLELQNARNRNELIEVAKVARFFQKICSAIKTKIEVMPMTDHEKDQCLRELHQLGENDWSE